MDIVREEYIGKLGHVKLNIQKYMDFIKNNQPQLGLVKRAPLQKRFYHIARIDISDNGLFIDMTNVVNTLIEKYNLKNNLNNNDLVELTELLNSVKSYEDLEKYFPSLIPAYNSWKKTGLSAYENSIQKVKSKYIAISREASTVRCRLKVAKDETKKANLSSALESLTKQIPFPLSKTLENKYTEFFIKDLISDVKVIIAYKDNGMVPINEENSYLFSKEVIRFYLAKSLYEKALSPDATSQDIEKAKKYLIDYIESLKSKEFKAKRMQESDVDSYIENFKAFIGVESLSVK